MPQPQGRARLRASELWSAAQPLVCPPDRRSSLASWDHERSVIRRRVKSAAAELLCPWAFALAATQSGKPDLSRDPPSAFGAAALDADYLEASSALFMAAAPWSIISRI